MIGYIKLDNGKFKKTDNLMKKCDNCFQLTGVEHLYPVDDQYVCEECECDLVDWCVGCGGRIEKQDNHMGYCGYCVTNYWQELFANKPKDAMPRDLGEDLIKRKQITRIETFISGWMDGRGGFIYGKYTREASGEDKDNIFKTLRDLGCDVVFILEDQGQFQYYWSVAVVGNLKTKEFKRVQEIVANIG